MNIFLRMGGCAMLVVCLAALLAGCGQQAVEATPSKPVAQTQKKSLADCLANAIVFYGGGGDVFKDDACTVSTGRRPDGGIWITSSDVTKEFNRDMTVWMPADWLNSKSPGYQTIANEFDEFMMCFQQPDNDQSGNPLKKSVPVRANCSFWTGSINNVPGEGINHPSKAPHFSFTALRRQ